MDLFNTKQKKEVASEREFMHDEQIISNATKDIAQDEMIQLEKDKERADLIRWQQDLSDEAFDYIMDIKGWAFVNGEWVKDKNMKPLANDQFIRRIRPLLKLATSRNLIMSNYSDERVRRSLSRAAAKFTDLIFFHWKTFEIDKRDAGYLVQSYQQLIEPTHYRSLQNGERKYITTSNRRTEVVSNRPEPVQKNTIATAFGFK